MRGSCRHFNTEQDIIDSLAADPESARALLQSLVDSRFAWRFVRELAPGESAQEDENHMIASAGGGPDGPDGEGGGKFLLYERVEDENAWIFRLVPNIEKALEYLAAPLPPAASP